MKYYFIFATILFLGFKAMVLADGEKIIYEKRLLPMFKTSCFKCHGSVADKKKAKGGLRLDSSENVTKLYRAAWAVGLALVGLDLIVHRHAETPFDGWFGFFGVYGFVACVSLVIAAKGLRRIVMRAEDYYER